MFNNRALLVLISAAAIAAISNGIRQANGLFLYPITTDLSVGREVFGFATALGFLVFGLILPFVGLFSDRHGPEKVLFAGGVLYAAGLALMAVAVRGSALPGGSIKIRTVAVYRLGIIRETTSDRPTAVAQAAAIKRQRLRK